MIGHIEVHQLLQQAITDERTAIHAYLLKSAILENQGYGALAGAYRKRAMEEMQHMHKLMDRMLLLEGEPDLGQALPKVVFMVDVEQMLKQDQELEAGAIQFYNDASNQASKLGDNGSRLLFEALLADEEAHIDWLENQLNVFGDIGQKLYLQKQA